MIASDHITTTLRNQPATVGILLFSGVEVLDFAGPFEVFSVASRIAPHYGKFEQPPFSVITVAATRNSTVARHGLRVTPDHDYSDCPALDILIVPGGIVDEPMRNPATLDWLRRQTRQSTMTASVCTGAFLLAQIGLLKGRTATTHWEDIPELRRMFPDTEVIEGVPYVDEGAIITSAGISAGIDMSLHLVRRIIGPEIASKTAHQMQYHWNPEQ
ncbi:MAG: DJ-1/PfpI family protein [Sphingobium sp.]|nr:DJ-1/PfpI family protein [Sphingobium sp.]